MPNSNNLAVPYLLLWINGGCNARCQTCEIWRDTTKTFISAAEIAAMADQWVAMGVGEVELCGEPTLHPELPAVCESILLRGIEIRFLSNGLRLQRFAPLVAEFGKSLTVSLDGPPAIHDLVRNVPMAYQRLKRGVSAVRELTPDIPVYGRCAVHRLNYRYLRATVETARSLDLTDISFIGLDVSSTAFGREGLDPGIETHVERLIIPREEVDALREEVEALVVSEASSFETGFLRESPNVLRSVLTDYFLEHWNPSLGSERTIRCNAPWTSAVIEPDGKVRPCWFLPPYGNLNDFKGGLVELLNSDSSRSYRDSIDVTQHPTCRACICPRNFVA